ncbi:hypothetical protein BKA24_001124 [Microbacterium marinum]|jgi:hypothetical protein|uniref:Uncharacterized protein n=1 Tax=Microbacterium marinum TaxID=421115 RepID=A0A7W7BPH1_9MICO|nr:protealysin inhibitor emfourin [Microbacterium marinum]MBB4666415.1 hypothetical protein [Microbacterium marinum]
MSPTAEHLTILVVRTGGFAGLRRAWRVSAAGSEATEWFDLVSACPWEAERPSGEAPGADQFTWEITAADDVRSGEAAIAGAPVRGDAVPGERRAVLADAEAGGAWRDLIDAVRDRGEPCAADAP